MGWTYTRIHRPASEELRYYVEGQGYYLNGFDQPAAKSPHRLLDIAIVAMKVAYMAVLDTRDNKVRCWVFLVDLKRHKDGSNYGYKDMDESMGPCETTCPQRILDLLSPVEECYGEDRPDSRRWAKEWRANCQARIDARKAKGTLKAGDKIKLAAPMLFKDGKERQVFTVLKDFRTVRFLAEDGARCCIRNYKNVPFTKIA